MQYLRVRWIHQYATEPVLLISELDDDRYEVRKVEVFADGRMGFASASQSGRETVLGEKPIPPISEIAADPQFRVEEVDADGFEEAWRAATSVS
jgi:hypothetical protein